MTGTGLLSFTAILSKLIVWPVVVTVFSRALLAALFCGVGTRFTRHLHPIARPTPDHDQWHIPCHSLVDLL